MNERLSTVEFYAQPLEGVVDVQHYLDPSQRVLKTINFNMVTAMVLNGKKITNEDQFTRSDKDFDKDGDPTLESITIAEAKAKRLIKLFKKLRPEHPYECHDLVVAVEGWRKDYGLDLDQMAVQPEKHVTEYEKDIVPGNPYTVQVLMDEEADPEFSRSHSCIGTNENRLIGIMGQGLMMTTMDPETTRNLYDNGAPYAFLARTILHGRIKR